MSKDLTIIPVFMSGKEIVEVSELLTICLGCELREVPQEKFVSNRKHKLLQLCRGFVFNCLSEF